MIMPAARRRFSAWTLIVPVVLAACIYVVASIIGSTRWTLGSTGNVPVRGVQPVAGRLVHAYATRAGDTWRIVARRTHVSIAQLHSLNPHDTAKGRIVPGEHLLVRP
jgi:LysM repeat protein